MSLDPQLAKQLRHVWFKNLNKFMLFMWRLGLGWMMNIWPDVFGRILVLTNTGWKSGLRRRTPLNYAIVDGEVYITAGFGKVAHWYRNVQANPAVEVWLPDGWWAGLAEDVTDSENYMDLMRQVLIGSGIVAPMFGLHPKTMPDAELVALTEGYRLIHIRRTEARTGPDGPGELAWVWPVMTLVLLLRRCRRK
jgi:deazaflavin-dependent oxidoreductase (nitroreductase family)